MLRSGPYERVGGVTRAWLCFLRSTLLFVNSVLALVGTAILAYGLYTHAAYRHEAKPSHGGSVPYPWFIVATEVMGGVTCGVAGAGLLAAVHPRMITLYAYLMLLVAMVFGELGLAVAVAANKHAKAWPPDPSGEYERLRKWMDKNYELSCWLGVGLLAFQVFAVAVCCALTSAHQTLEEQSDDEESGWEQRHALAAPLSPAASGGSSAARRAASPRQFPANDPWSRRMRKKYGLEPSSFSDDAEGRRLSALTHHTPSRRQGMGTSPPPGASPEPGCTLM